VDTDDWFDALAAALAEVAPEGSDGPVLSDAERDGLLDLARVAAHTAERWTAPVSTFLAGVVLAELPSERRAAAIRSVVETLEPTP
jgi:hypothetical protein